MMATKEWYVSRRTKRETWNWNACQKKGKNAFFYGSFYHFPACHNMRMNMVVYSGNLNKQGK